MFKRAALLWLLATTVPALAAPAAPAPEEDVDTHVVPDIDYLDTNFPDAYTPVAGGKDYMWFTSFERCKDLCGTDVQSCRWKVTSRSTPGTDCTVTCVYRSGQRTRSC